MSAAKEWVLPPGYRALHDIVQVIDGALGTTVCRVSELHLVWYPQEGHWDLVIVGGRR